MQGRQDSPLLECGGKSSYALEAWEWPRRIGFTATWKHKTALFAHPRQRWQDFFQAEFEVLLYGLTSTFIEGEGEEIPKAKHGYSRDQPFDCLKQRLQALAPGLTLRTNGTRTNKLTNY